MSKHYIKNIEIRNFKCFENFKAEGFGRVNLIGGKNNVGKTAFMEAVYLNTSKEKKSFLKFIRHIILNRDSFFWIHHQKNLKKAFKNWYTTYKEYTKIFKLNTLYSIKTNITNLKFSFRYKYLILKIIEFKINDTKDLSYIDFIKNPNKNNNVLFLNFTGMNDMDIEYFYKKLKDIKEFNNHLTRFDKNLHSLEIKEESEIFIHTKDKKELHLREYGDGIRLYINILLFLNYTSNSYLFIDEIENGIHYSKLDDLWEIILTISKQQNVQVFATTHSKECIESYARVAKKLEDEEIGFIELCRREDEIKAFVYPYDWFIDEIEQEHEVRGCL